MEKRVPYKTGAEEESYGSIPLSAIDGIVSAGPAGVVKVAFRWGLVAGEHHKQWVIDQMLIELLGQRGYWRFVAEYEKYWDEKWDRGIQP